jgi:hypothetical protein
MASTLEFTLLDGLAGNTGKKRRQWLCAARLGARLG